MGQGKPGVQKDIRAFFVAPLQRSAESGKPEDSPASPQQAASRQLAGGGARRQAVPAADSKIGAACTGTDESGRATPSADACIGADGAKQAADAAAPEVAAIAELDGPPAAAADVRKGSSNFSSSSGLTEYELERLARIRRNQEARWAGCISSCACKCVGWMPGWWGSGSTTRCARSLAQRLPSMQLQVVACSWSLSSRCRCAVLCCAAGNAQPGTRRAVCRAQASARCTSRTPTA